MLKVFRLLSVHQKNASSVTMPYKQGTSSGCSRHRTCHNHLKWTLELNEACNALFWRKHRVFCSAAADESLVYRMMSSFFTAWNRVICHTFNITPGCITFHVLCKHIPWKILLTRIELVFNPSIFGSCLGQWFGCTPGLLQLHPLFPSIRILLRSLRYIACDNKTNHGAACVWVCGISSTSTPITFLIHARKYFEAQRSIVSFAVLNCAPPYVYLDRVLSPNAL